MGKIVGVQSDRQWAWDTRGEHRSVVQVVWKDSSTERCEQTRDWPGTYYLQEAY